MGHPSQCPKSICLSAYFNIKFWHCLMTTNGQLNDTRDYHIKPSNSTCNMISCFLLKGLCSSLRGKNCYFQHSQILIIVKSVIKENIFINIKAKKCTSKSVLHWEFASVYLSHKPSSIYSISDVVFGCGNDLRLVFFCEYIIFVVILDVEEIPWAHHCKQNRHTW